MLDHKSLKARQRKIREGFPSSLSLRVHRALSWLDRAEQETEDQDARFIFLWIAFNAAYANEILDRQTFTERKLFRGFLNRLIESDERQFWDHHNGQLSEPEWREAFQRSRASANRALGRMDTTRLLTVMFDRLYVLRNQLLHGGATWNSGVNRGQIIQGATIMGLIVPTVIHLMMEHPNQVWGDPCYPVVE